MSSGFTHSTFRGDALRDVWARRWRMTDLAALAIIICWVRLRGRVRCGVRDGVGGGRGRRCCGVISMGVRLDASS